MKKFTLLILSAFFYTVMYAQIDFEEHIVIDGMNAVNAPQQVFAIDIDNDGFLDALFSTENAHKIGWFKNIDGNGNYGDLNEISTITTLYGNYRIYPVDMDNDGDIDVISTYKHSGDYKISWYENTNGEGVFSEEKLITDNKFDYVEVEDIDNDGDIDIAYSAKNEEIIAWYENIDENSFMEHVISSNTYQARLIALVDIDTDGDIDIAFNNNYLDIKWFENNGTGTFNIEKSANTEGTNPNQFIDMDNDGDIDLITTKYHTDETTTIFWYENLDGNGNYTNQRTIKQNIPWLTSIHISDIDNDNDKDIFITTKGLSGSDYNNCLIAWFKNISTTGTFSAQQIISTSNFLPKFISTGDINNDGKKDVITASVLDDKIGWFCNIDGQGTFDNQHNITTSVDGIRNVTAGDLNGDDKIDVLTSQSANGTITWFESLDGNGNFANQKTIPFYDITAENSFIIDVDNDGDNDIISNLHTDIMWFENIDGEADFSQVNYIVDKPGHFPRMHYGDIDEDGDIDVIVSSTKSYSTLWSENTDGQGSYGNEHVLFEGEVIPNTIELVDIDGDNHLDVLTGTESFNRISWYRNIDGLGNFDERVHISYYEGIKPISVCAVDLDGDGDKDVVCNAYYRDTILWFENLDGMGNFGGLQPISTYIDNASQMIVTDIDSDNDVDVLYFSYEDKLLGWYENTDGHGNFEVQHMINTNVEEIVSIFCVDLDIDDDMDIIIASKNPDSLIWYENKGPLGVQESPITNFSIYPNPTATTLNIDANIDISKIEIYDQLGNRMLMNRNKKQIDVSQLDTGIYFVRVKDNEGTSITSKLIKK